MADRNREKKVFRWDPLMLYRELCKEHEFYESQRK